MRSRRRGRSSKRVVARTTTCVTTFYCSCIPSRYPTLHHLGHEASAWAHFPGGASMLRARFSLLGLTGSQYLCLPVFKLSSPFPSSPSLSRFLASSSVVLLPLMIGSLASVACTPQGAWAGVHVSSSRYIVSVRIPIRVLHIRMMTDVCVPAWDLWTI